MMPTVGKDGVHRVQIAARIPEDLLHQVRVHCVETNKSMQDFVAQALTTQMALDREPSASESQEVLERYEEPTSFDAPN